MCKKNRKIIIIILLTLTLCFILSPVIKAEEELPTLAPINTPDPGKLATKTPAPDNTPDNNGDPDKVEGFLWSTLLEYFAYACFVAAPFILVAGIIIVIVVRVRNKKKEKEGSEDPKKDQPEEPEVSSADDNEDGNADINNEQ